MSISNEFLLLKYVFLWVNYLETSQRPPFINWILSAFPPLFSSARNWQIKQINSTVVYEVDYVYVNNSSQKLEGNWFQKWPKRKLRCLSE